MYVAHSGTREQRQINLRLAPLGHFENESSTSEVLPTNIQEAMKQLL